MLILNPKLSLLIFVFIGISAVATNYVSSLSQRYYGENFAAMGELSGKIEEVYSGNRIIRSLINKRKQLRKFQSLIKSSLKQIEEHSLLTLPYTQL